MRFARETGIPTTKLGIKNKIERIVANKIIKFLNEHI